RDGRDLERPRIFCRGLSGRGALRPEPHGTGRTSSVNGSIDVEGATVASGSFTVDMTTVTSDEPRRDARPVCLRLRSEFFLVTGMVDDVHIRKRIGLHQIQNYLHDP